eukprot:CAMPEP_0201282224 /NCGR_PEP_ID=MMETSP1317-20130820/5080_1 /ASSEMBLY_ACC=CAM_ASM_000770 /TAXON_ID=187299 /ORGANISM="Undescribed Undescribed, Strain Undescribed" /LENGTH=54 /DNA_ID=CAMNT_0047594263 /DNA_START=1 /DNA_END=162 /DNA_ORIENTATION=-
MNIPTPPPMGSTPSCPPMTGPTPPPIMNIPTPPPMGSTPSCPPITGPTPPQTQS